MRGFRTPYARWLSALIPVALAFAGCSVERSLPEPNCTSGDSGIISAQSVPFSEYAPCLETLPAGWSVDSVNIDQNGLHVTLDSDRAGSGAANLQYRRSCDVGEAAPTDVLPTIDPPPNIDAVKAFVFTERLEPGFREARYYTFSGGCVWWEFDFDNGVSAALSTEVRNTLTLISREALNQGIRDSFIDEEMSWAG